MSGLKRKADAAASAVIPLTTTHGGHSLHVQILPRASSKPLEELTAKQKRRRIKSAELHQRTVQPPSLAPSSPLPKLSPRETLTFSQLSGQQTHRALRAMRSFLHSKGLNFLCSDKKLRAAEKELQLPLHVHSIHPIAFRVQDVTTPLSMMLSQLHAQSKLAVSASGDGYLSLQLQVDKGSDITLGLLKLINVRGEVRQQNIIPIFYYIGNENYHTIAALLKPLLSQLADFALPPALLGCFSHTLKVLGADIKATQIILGLSPSSSSSFPCSHCLIPLEELRSRKGVTREYPLRNSLLHGADHLDLQMDHNGDIAFAKDYHNCIHPPPFVYGLPALQHNIVVGMPVLHISIGLGNKLLKLVRSFAPDAAAFTQLLTQHRLTFYKHHNETLIGPQVHRLLSGKEPLYLQVLEAVKEVKLRDSYVRRGKLIITQSSPYPRLLELFQLLAACYKLYTADTFLRPEEVTSLGEQCRSFGTKFHEYFPQESITPKLHLLAVDIPRFARMYGTVGLYSEQAVEHARRDQPAASRLRWGGRQHEKASASISSSLPQALPFHSFVFPSFAPLLRLRFAPRAQQRHPHRMPAHQAPQIEHTYHIQAF